MFESDNRNYYDRRAAQAIELGDRAETPKIAALHYELALRYATLSVQGGQAKPDDIYLSNERRSDQSERVGAICRSSAEPESELKQA